MTPSNRRLIPERIQNAYMRLIAPLIRLFTRWGMNPNTFTVAGVIITSFAAVAFFLQSPRLGGVSRTAGRPVRLHRRQPRPQFG